MAEVFFAFIVTAVTIIFVSLVDRSRSAANGIEKPVPSADSDDDIDFEATAGFIWVTRGSADEVRAAILEYGDLYAPKQPRTFRAELHSQADETIAVLFPDGLPARDLVNMTGWLNAPLDEDGVSEAFVWLTSRRDGVRYFFRAEPEKPGSDTLIGSDEQGQGVHVYLPDNTLLTVSESISFEQEPEIQHNVVPEVLDLKLDANMTFGNPGFEISVSVRPNAAFPYR